MLTVATHSGTFHADDVFAYAILRAAHDGQVQLIRSRDMDQITAAQVVFDVGGIFDPASHRYDHHMRDKPLRENGEPFSSAGLVWRDFGAAVVAGQMPTADATVVARIVAKLDQGLLRDVDLMDNGAMNPTPGHFSTLLESFNGSFAEPDRDENQAFQQAADVAALVLNRAIARTHAAVLAEQSVAQAAALADDPRIIVLDSRLPWEEAVFDLNLTQALYVVRPAGNDWTCSAVPPDRGSFAQRLPLPDAWGGVRDADLAALTGVADATFCHPARFVCGARSRDGAIAMARLAVGG